MKPCVTKLGRQALERIMIDVESFVVNRHTWEAYGSLTTAVKALTDCEDNWMLDKLDTLDSVLGSVSNGDEGHFEHLEKKYNIDCKYIESFLERNG